MTKMHFMDKISIAIAALAVLGIAAVLLLQPGAFQANEEKPVIKVAYLPVLQSLPLFVAVEQGMFEREGLVIQMERIESPNQIIDALVSGKADAGAPSVAAGITAIVDVKNPGSLKVYSLTCGTLDRLNDELLVAKNSTINSISDLRGKRLGHMPGIQFSTVAKKILMENGVDPSDVTLVELPVPNQLPTLAAGGVDAVLTLEPTGTLGGQKNVSRILVRNPMVRYIADPWCGAAGVISAKFLKDHPREAETFVKIMREAINETYDNETTKTYLVKYLSLPESVAKEVPLPLMVSTKGLDQKIADAYQKFADVFYELNVTQAQPDVKRLFWEEI